jgi:NAD-dependent dihydropyrimidine dehydrogenase PreA subunit
MSMNERAIPGSCKDQPPQSVWAAVTPPTERRSGPLKTSSESSGTRSHAPLVILRELPKRLFQIVFRMVPYPTKPRLIQIGNPRRHSPILVTTNYDLTVRRVCRALEGLDCYLLVAPAGGLDVWCAAGGGRFTIDSIISILKTSRVAELVDHRRLLLPQLCANGINMFELKRRTGWTGVFGPVRAADVPEYLQTRRKTEQMTRMTFTIRERLEMATAMWASLSLRYTLFPCLILGLMIAPWFILVLALLSLGVSLGCFVLPGKTFVQKAGFLGLLGVIGLLGVTVSAGNGTALLMVKWVPLFGFASFLVGTAFPSYSPYWPCGYSKLFYGSCDLDLSIREEQCIGCKICDQVCPVECFSLTERRKMFFANPEICVGCGACVIQCPTDAIINEVAEDHLRQTASG